MGLGGYIILKAWKGTVQEPCFNYEGSYLLEIDFWGSGGFSRELPVANDGGRSTQRVGDGVRSLGPTGLH